jgi:SAM-dependent methyltransferase
MANAGDAAEASLLNAGGAIRSSYNTVADAYAREFSDELADKPFDRTMLDDFAAACPAPGLVLDMGCGPGHIARYLDGRGVTVAGIDLSDAMVEVARRLSPHLMFTVGDMRAIDHPAETVAGVAAFYSLIHIPRDEVLTVLAELHRVLVPGGRLLIAVHGGLGTFHRDDFLGHAVPFEATLFALGELVSFVESAGLWVDEARQRAPYEFEHPTARLYVAAHRPA